MSLAAVPGHWKRYKDIAWLLVKYGRSDLISGMRIEGFEAPDAEDMKATGAENLAKDLERMGPTFIKIGQLLSSRGDLLPPAYLAALARLQDDVEPFSFAEVEKIVTSELGARISKAFSEFESTPLAAASLGQVHRARLRDGRPVAVKVQRPGIREQILDDLEAFSEIAAFLDRHSEFGERYELEKMVEEFRKTIMGELDYTKEASNLETIGRNMRGFPHIFVPAPMHDYTTSRVLTMEYVEGKKITALAPVARMDLDAKALADELFRAYLKQILVDGLLPRRSASGQRLRDRRQPHRAPRPRDGRGAFLPRCRRASSRSFCTSARARARPAASGSWRSGARSRASTGRISWRASATWSGDTGTRRSRRCRSGAYSSTSRVLRETRGCGSPPS